MAIGRTILGEGMRDSLVGLQAGVDARKWARLLSHAHDTAIRSGRVPSIVRGVIADSWERCSQTGVDPSAPGAPLLLEAPEARDRWREHPLSRMTDILQHALGDLLYEARHIVVVSDADGCLLWADGHPDVLRAAERIRFWPGHEWSESAAGTNAVGTALAADAAVQVFSAEHYRSAVHGWQCSGAPVHDPETGATLGAIDVTGRYETAHPHNLSLVTLAARLVQGQLRTEMLERDAQILGLFADHTARHGGPAAAVSRSGRVLAATPAAWTQGRIELGEAAVDGGEVRLADGTTATVQPLGDGALIRPLGPRAAPRRSPTLRLEALGHDRVRLHTVVTRRLLTARHGELMVLLDLHREGIDARSLAELLYGEPGHETAVRAELHRLRAIVGEALQTRPYRLDGVGSDLADLRRCLHEGRLAAARELYPGPLLPRSNVPAIVGERARLAAQLEATGVPSQSRSAGP